RLPGQWLDPAWENAVTPATPYYNLYRWYDPALGRYDSPDPLATNDPAKNPFAYAKLNPLVYRDVDGLDAQVCCRLLANVVLGTTVRQRHCYVQANDGTRYGLYPERSPRGQIGVPRTNDERDRGGICKRCECRQGADAAKQDACFQDYFDGYP